MATQELVLVTGSNGLIGSAIAQRLVTHYDVIGLDCGDIAEPLPGIKYVNCDITSDTSVQNALNEVRRSHGGRVASVIHLAAFYDFSGEPSPLYEDVTVQGTRRLLHGLRNFDVEQFIFASTMLVHAPCQPGQRINEDWPLEAKWDYPQSKVETEALIRAEHGDIPVVLLRIAAIYDDFCHSIPLSHQMQRIYEKQRIGHLFPGDLLHGQAFLHLHDLLDALERTVQRRAQLPPETVLLLGEEETLSYDELQRIFGQLMHGEEWETHEIPKALAKAGAWLQDLPPVESVTGEQPFVKPWMTDIADDHYALDISRAKSLLSWQPQHALRRELPRLVAALKAKPDQWYRQNKLKLADTNEKR